MNMRALPWFAYQRIGLARALLFVIAPLLLQYVNAGDELDPCRFRWAIRMDCK